MDLAIMSPPASEFTVADDNAADGAVSVKKLFDSGKWGGGAAAAAAAVVVATAAT